MTTATNEPGADQKVTQATATAAAEARTAERARMSGILGCAEAKGRETLANHLAMNTEMSVEDATKVLAAAPSGTVKPAAQAAATGAVNPFAAAMAASGNPNIGADAANASTEAESPVNAILADYAAVSGRKFGTK